MKLAIQLNGKVIYINEEKSYDNILDDDVKEFIINYAMEELENEKNKINRKREVTKIKKLGIHPYMKPGKKTN